MSSIVNFAVCKDCGVAELCGLSQTMTECPKMMVVVVVTVFTTVTHSITEPGSQTPIRMGQVTLSQQTPIGLRHSTSSLHQPSLASVHSEGLQEQLPAEDDGQVKDYS